MLSLSAFPVALLTITNPFAEKEYRRIQEHPDHAIGTIAARQLNSGRICPSLSTERASLSPCGVLHVGVIIYTASYLPLVAYEVHCLVVTFIYTPYMPHEVHVVNWRKRSPAIATNIIHVCEVTWHSLIVCTCVEYKDVYSLSRSDYLTCVIYVKRQQLIN